MKDIMQFKFHVEDIMQFNENFNMEDIIQFN